MPHPAFDSIYEAISSIRLIDPHTHINPHSPASTTLADLLGYHYYTELAHSAGMPKAEIEEEGIDPRELVRRLVSNLGPIENTAQYSWLIEICRTFFGFDGDRLDESNWETVYDAAESQMGLADWPQMVLDQSNVEAVFLTNDFDDPLTGFDTDTYIPCLRTDDLVFHLAKYQTRQRLEACTGIELDGSLVSLRDSLKQRFEHFVAAGARACAISLPPTFEPINVSDGRAATALDEILRKGALADDAHQLALSRRVFWTLAELCDEYGLPFDLMIGVNRGVYAGGVYQGQDLYDSRVSLIQYRELFNSFPNVKFPISVLASVTNQELVSYAWIFPNVVTNGHWWYSNTPSFIARDAAARLEAVPQTKQIAYYSDAYKLEFVWPKFDMYRQILAGILADQFVGQRGWNEQRAIELGRRVLRDNVDELFPRPAVATSQTNLDPHADTWMEDTTRDSEDPQATWIGPAAAGSSASLAAGAIGMVEVEDNVADPTNVQDPQAAEEPDDEEEHDEMATIIEDQPGVVFPTSEPDEVLAQLEQFEAQADLPDRPTVVETPEEETASETEDTQVESDEHDSATFDPAETIEEPSLPPNLQLDPIPSADEIQAVDVSDVELIDITPDQSMPDAEAIETEADSSPLDVGNLLGDQPDETSEPPAEVRMLRGETSFLPDEDSLQLQANPTTGELTFPVASPDEAGDQGNNVEIEQLMLNDTDDPQQTIDDTSEQQTVVMDEHVDIGVGEEDTTEEPTDDQQPT